MRIWIVIGALNGALAVILGAVGAHALDPALPAATHAMFQTAVQYHFFHALALIGVGAISMRIETGFGRHTLMIAGLAFSLGIVLFCGGLYALSGFGIALGGHLAPFGGTLFIIGWLAFALTGLTIRVRRF